jgi:hypothetical protein
MRIYPLDDLCRYLPEDVVKYVIFRYYFDDYKEERKYWEFTTRERAVRRWYKQIDGSRRFLPQDRPFFGELVEKIRGIPYVFTSPGLCTLS